jgi:hypothetical protein
MWKRLLDPNGPRSVFGVICKPFKRMAGTTRLELATSAVTGQRSNQLNYVPTLFSLAYWEALVFPVFLTVHRVARFNHSTPHKRIPGA